MAQGRAELAGALTMAEPARFCIGNVGVGRVPGRRSRQTNSNYAFKPTAEQALRIDRATSCRGGLTRR